MDFSKSRLAKMIADTRSLTPLFYDKERSRDPNQTILSKFFNGGRLILVGANSAAGLASRPIRILLCDEVDRFPESASGEGDPVDLASKRCTTFWNYKIGMFSTPTIKDVSRIDIEYLLGTQEEWSHCCPHCHNYHALFHEDMECDYQQSVTKATGKVVIMKQVLWRCPSCKSLTTELELKRSPQKYIGKNLEAIQNGIRSFWVNGFSSPWLSWNDIMREWYEARGNSLRESVIYNTRFGLSYEYLETENDINEYMMRLEDYGSEIPNNIKLLTAAVDVQGNRLEYEICGWAPGEERYGIQKGFIIGAPNMKKTWLLLDKVLDKEYNRRDGTYLKVYRTFIDSGFATRAVYEYCQARAYRGRFAIKGKSAPGIPLLYRYGHATNTRVLLLIIGVDDGKQEIMSRLSITKTGEQYMHYPTEDFMSRGYNENYFRQLLSERKVVKRSGGILHSSWEPIKKGIRNEALDLAVYNLAAMKSCELFKSAQEDPTARDSQKQHYREVNIWD